MPFCCRCKSNMASRDIGFYWVRVPGAWSLAFAGGEWVIAFWDGTKWKLSGHATMFDGAFFEEIGVEDLGPKPRSGCKYP